MCSQSCDFKEYMAGKAQLELSMCGNFENDFKQKVQ